MNKLINTSLSQPTVEQLLTSLAGIVSARTVTGTSGQLEEIHILATADLQPKQIVRNVESALSAGLGIKIDRRIVSVAQLRTGAAEEIRAASGARADQDAVEPGWAEVAAELYGAGAAPEPIHANAAPEQSQASDPEAMAQATYRTAAPAAPESAAASSDRVVFVRHDIAVDSNRTVSCTVVFRLGDDEFTGHGNGFDSPQGRAEAAARAVFDAFATSRSADRLGLEGVAIVDTPSQMCVLVVARSLDGRRKPSLTGAAPIRDSTEEAAILAALQATNHWRANT